jgi:hypothetical protein
MTVGRWVVDSLANDKRAPTGLRDIVETRNGTIYVWTDNPSLLGILPVDPGTPIRDRIAVLSPPVGDALLQRIVCHEFEGIG